VNVFALSCLRGPGRYASGAVVLLALAAGSCVRAEEPMLSAFFSVSGLRDKTALAKFSLVSFDPPTDGVVTEFRIEAVSPERRRPLNGNAWDDTRVVQLSIGSLPAPGDVSRADGNLVSKSVTVAAQVRPPSGQANVETLVITMARAILRGGSVRDETVGQWVITALEKTEGSARTGM
jgi:hypothetical protein